MQKQGNYVILELSRDECFHGTSMSLNPISF